MLRVSLHRGSSFIRSKELVLFQGDSITDAFRKPEEINNAYQLGSGYAFLVASKLMRDRPADALQFVNRGIAGDTLGRLHARWDLDALSIQPNVISLLVGINDVAHVVKGDGAMSAQFEREYRTLLERSKAALPAVRFILCEPFALPCGLVSAEWIQPLARAQQSARALAREFGAMFVPLQCEFDAATQHAPDEYWLYDGIHPTAAGHQLIAQAWLRAVRNPKRRTRVRTTARRRRLDEAPVR